jgi:hypothetical protein
LGTPQTWLTSYTTGILAGFTEVLTAIDGGYTTAGLTLPTQVNISYYKGFTNFLESSGRYRAIPTLRTVDGLPTPLIEEIIGWEVNPKVGSQRRRNQQGS